MGKFTKSVKNKAVNCDDYCLHLFKRLRIIILYLLPLQALMEQREFRQVSPVIHSHVFVHQ